MKNTFLSIFLATCPLVLWGQNAIEGTVKDEKNQAIFFATAALYYVKDSTIAQSQTTDETGKFRLTKLKEGDYFLKVVMLSYVDKIIENIEIPSNEPLILDIVLTEDATVLSTVEVKSKVPLLEQKADKLVVNVAENITNTGGSLLDVMKKVPGMIVTNDKLRMVGAGSPTILIDGKSTQYMDVESLLKDMPGDNIKKVEIIHQPGAEYEAAGSGPILNIILKKNALLGTNGSISVGVGKGELWDYTTGLNLSHRSGGLNITGSIGYSRNAWVDELLIVRRLNNISPIIDGTYDQVSKDAARPHTYRGNFRIDWDVTKKHRIGLETKYYNNDNQYTATNTTDVDLISELVPDYQLFTLNDIDRTWNYVAVNPYYIFDIDTAGQKLTFDINLARYKPNSFNQLNTTNNLDTDEAKTRYFQIGDTRIFATSLDYKKPISNSLELKAGLKYSFADLDNNLQSEYLDTDNTWQNNTNQSNHYLFDEKIYAIYSKLSWKAGDWSGTAGLRYENSQSLGESLTIDSTLNRTISKVFPSFSVSRKLGKVLSASIAYSYRIDRPRYSTLNPFVYYLDPFTFETGNPNIRPELTHSTKFSLSFQGQPFFNIAYNRSQDAIVEVTQQEPNSEEASKTDINFDNQSTFSTSLFFPMEFIPGLTGGYGGIIVDNNRYNSFYNDGIFKRSRWSITTFIQLEFKIPGDIHAELGGWYTSGQQEGIFNSEHLFGTSFALSKKFLNKKAKISIGIEDFVNRFAHLHVDYQQDLDVISKWQAPVVSAKFSYKFGNQHLKAKKKHVGSAAEELRRATQGK